MLNTIKCSPYIYKKEYLTEIKNQLLKDNRIHRVYLRTTKENNQYIQVFWPWMKKKDRPRWPSNLRAKIERIIKTGIPEATKTSSKTGKIVYRVN
tara:strand:+ start:874 stop:1158 length:285 start_codon:yes stop_codon:yes gene_type:complete